MKFLDQRRAARALASSEAAVNATAEDEQDASDSDEAVAADPTAEALEADLEAHMDAAADSGEEIIAVSTPQVNKVMARVVIPHHPRHKNHNPIWQQ